MNRHYLAPFTALLSALLVAFALATSALVAAPASQSGAPLPQDHVPDDVVCGGLDAPNLLHNPSFEGPYSAYVPPGGHDDCPHGVCNTAQMADGWTPYWRSHDPADPGEIIRMPEYKPADAGQDPPRTHSGDRAQQYFTFSSTHEAGFYQQVSVTPGELYCFGIWGHSWSSSDDDAHTSDSELEQNIGIDPTGGANWESADVIWGGRKQYYYEPGEENPFGAFSLLVRAEASQLTVYTWSRPVWPVKHNDVYWDDAILLRAPQEPVMSLSHHDFAALVAPTGVMTHSTSIDISFAQDPGVIWRASMDAGATLDVTLSAAAGMGANDLTISFDSAGYAPGSYHATITVEADPAVAGSPANINVSLHVVDEIHRQLLPFYGK